MRLRLHYCCAVLSCIILAYNATSSLAAQHVITGQQSGTVGLPGGLAALVDPSGDLYTANSSFAMLVIFDTGASGCMLSQTDAGPSNLNIPITGETYEDVGIGGMETFNVSQTTGLMLAPIGIIADYGGGWDFDDLYSVHAAYDYDPSEDIANYSDYGDYNFQIRQSDPTYAGMFDLAVNVIGTPVLNDYVLRVTPGQTGYFSLIPTIDYLDAELLTEMPGDLPSSGVYKIALKYENFIADDPPVTTSTNPTIENIKLNRGANELTSTWLFDTGGSVSIIGRDMAVSLGIDLENDDPVESILVTGVGGEDRILFGYLMDSLTVPLTDGDELVWEDVVIFVPEDGALPADLTGIFGMNLLNQSISDSNIFTLQDSPFSDWYVDGVNSELTLVLGTTVPEPGTFVLLAVAGMALFVRFRFRQARNAR